MAPTKRDQDASAEIRGTKTGKPKRLLVSEELADWIERHVDPADRFSRAPPFPNPRTGRMWPHKAPRHVCSKAVAAADIPHVSLYEGTKHSMATDAIRRGVSERALQRFLGHASLISRRRYARLADDALIRCYARRGQVGDKGPQDNPKHTRKVVRGPSRIRTGKGGKKRK